MNDSELIKKWLSAFGSGVDNTIIEDHVTSW